MLEKTLGMPNKLLNFHKFYTDYPWLISLNNRHINAALEITKIIQEKRRKNK